MAMGRSAGVAVSVSEELEDAWKPRPRTAGPACRGLFGTQKRNVKSVRVSSS